MSASERSVGPNEEQARRPPRAFVVIAAGVPFNALLMLAGLWFLGSDFDSHMIATLVAPLVVWAVLFASVARLERKRSQGVLGGGATPDS